MALEQALPTRPITKLRWLPRSDAGRLSAAFILGAAAGELAGPRAASLGILGELLIGMLTLLVLPLLVCTIVIGVAALKPASLGRLGAKAIVLYVSLSFAAAAIGIATAFALRPGAGFALPAAGVATPWVTRIGIEWLPDSVARIFAHGRYLALVLIAMLFAVAVAAARDRRMAAADTVYQFFERCGRVTQMLLRWVMRYAVVGIFALSASLFGQTTAAALAHFASLFITVYAAQAGIAVLLAVVIAAALPGRNTLVGLREVLVTAFSTGSSAATLPVELRTAEHHLRIAPRLLSFTLPLGVSVSKAGSAVYIAIAALFAANAGGIPLTAATTGWIWLLSVAGSLATPPGGAGALIMLGFVFTEAHLPLAAIGVIAAVPLIGRLNTPVNSLGRLAVTSVMERSAGS